MSDVPLNPLLQAPGLCSIANWLSNSRELIKMLIHSPIPQAGKCTVARENRRRLTDQYLKIYVPTHQAIQISDRILNIMYSNLERRNPIWPEVQRWINSTQQWHGRSVDEIPWNPIQAKGMIIEGITGIGKSHIVDRVLTLLPQVVDHEPQGDWGMLKLRQLVYLKVHMPADQSRKGLLVSILVAMDTVLETNYCRALVKTTSRVETLIVNVMQLLVQHRCGMLIIEEAQEDNLGSRAFSRDFLNFFLRILNWGIPILIIGNPLSFRELRMHAQDVDRFSEGGWFTMLPELGPDSDTWRKSWMPGLWAPSLLDEPDAPFSPLATYPDITDWPTFLWQLTGGMPRHLGRLRSEVMEWALVNNVSQVTSELVLKVFNHSPKFSVVKERNKALANKDIKALMAYQDLPIEQLRNYWLADKPTPSQTKTSHRSSVEAKAVQEVFEMSAKIESTTEQKKLISDLKALTHETSVNRQSKQTRSRK